MKFRQLPPRLQWYIGLNVLLPILVWFAVPHRHGEHNFWLVVVLLLFTLLFATWKVELTVLSANMTLTFAVVCLALLVEGLDTAIVCAALGAFVGTYVRPAKKGWKVKIVAIPLHRALFNVGNCVLSCEVSALLYRFTIQHNEVSLAVILGLTVFTTSYFLINTLGVSLAVALQQNLRWFEVWQQNFLWTAPGYFASASAAVAVQAVFVQVGVWALTFLPWLYVVYYSYKLYTDRIHSDTAHIVELNKLNQAIIASLAMAIDAKDRHTCSHINRVEHYAVALARAVGLKGPDMDAVTTGALVHDIGKLGIPDHILLKPAKLNQEEFKRIQEHVRIGAEILSPVPFSFPVVDVVLSHHERWDGLGYPSGLKGTEIPIGGRIIALVDVFDAVTSDRPYRQALSDEDAIEVLCQGAGREFDPDLVKTFVEILPAVKREVDVMEAAARARAEVIRPTEEGSSALARISQAAAEMAAVCDVAHALVDEETLEGAVNVAVSRARALLPVDTAVLYIKATDASHLTAMGVEGKYREKLLGMTIQVGEGVSGWVAENQQPRANVSAALDVARRFEPQENVDLSAATAVPLVHGPDILGVLAVYTTAYSVLTEHHLHVLNILAEHTAGAIQNLRRFEQHRELAFTDPLTGLANSRCLFRHLERLVRQEDPNAPWREPPFSLVMLDLDNFKDVNDLLGHMRGDDLLRTIADTLTTIARPHDLVCRYAGDEFVVLLVGADQEQAEGAVERIRQSIDSIGIIDGQVRVRASVGVASYPNDGLESRGLINAADRRMYEDKFQRRGQELHRRAGHNTLDALAGALAS